MNFKMWKTYCAAATLTLSVIFAGGGSGVKMPLPVVVYSDGKYSDDSKGFVPSGFMGHSSLNPDFACAENPKSGATCIKINFPTVSGEWAALSWQHPANNWGEKDGGLDLTGAKKLSFWARGAKGGEVVSFNIGGDSAEAAKLPFPNSAKADLGKVTLEKDWKEYSIPLAGLNLSRIVYGFTFIVIAGAEPAYFYLDEIRYE